MGLARQPRQKPKVKRFTLARWLAEWLAGKRANETVSAVVRRDGRIVVQVEESSDQGQK